MLVPAEDSRAGIEVGWKIAGDGRAYWRASMRKMKKMAVNQRAWMMMMNGHWPPPGHGRNDRPAGPYHHVHLGRVGWVRVRAARVEFEPPAGAGAGRAEQLHHPPLRRGRARDGARLLRPGDGEYDVRLGERQEMIYP